MGNMHELLNRIYRLTVWTDCRGQDMVEYALVAGMIVVAAVGAMPLLSGAVVGAFSRVGSVIVANIP